MKTPLVLSKCILYIFYWKLKIQCYLLKTFSKENKNNFHDQTHPIVFLKPVYWSLWIEILFILKPEQRSLGHRAIEPS